MTCVPPPTPPPSGLQGRATIAGNWGAGGAPAMRARVGTTWAGLPTARVGRNRVGAQGGRLEASSFKFHVNSLNTN